MTDLQITRHLLATLAYRAAKTMRGAPESFAEFRARESSRTPNEIVAHMGDLFDWAYTMTIGELKWNTAVPQDWKNECERFFKSLRKFDTALARHEMSQPADTPFPYELTRMIQGQIADALTHTGQLAMLRNMHGSPMKGESYNRAEIVIGKVGMDQTPADKRYEF